MKKLILGLLCFSPLSAFATNLVCENGTIEEIVRQTTLLVLTDVGITGATAAAVVTLVLAFLKWIKSKRKENVSTTVSKNRKASKKSK